MPDSQALSMALNQAAELHEHEGRFKQASKLYEHTVSLMRSLNEASAVPDSDLAIDIGNLDEPLAGDTPRSSLDDGDILKFAQREFGQVTPLLKKQIDDIFKKKDVAKIKKEGGITDIKTRKEYKKELELLQSYCDYVILAVKEELPKRGIKFNRSNKCLSNIRKILGEIEGHFYDWDWEKCITKGWFIENEEKINQLVPIRNPEENRDNESNKNKRSNREWFGCNELVKECHGLIGIDIYWNNPLFGGFDIHVPYRVRKKNTLDYLILNS